MEVAMVTKLQRWTTMKVFVKEVFLVDVQIQGSSLSRLQVLQPRETSLHPWVYQVTQ